MASKEELEVALTEAHAQLTQLKQWAEVVTAPPNIFAVCVRLNRDKKLMTLQGGSGLIELQIPPGLNPSIGSLVTVSMESKVPTNCDDDVMPGPIVRAGRKLGEDLLEVTVGPPGMGSSRTVFCCYPTVENELVLLDASSSVVTRCLGPDPAQAKANVVENFQRVLWDEIGGLDDVKQFFYEVLERPLLNTTIYKHYNVPLPKGCLLFGPPGCGKTLIAKAAMTDVLNRYQHSGEGAFLNVKGPELLSPWVGVTEQKIREMFARARKFKADNGFPCFIFIDEAEAILNVRGSGRSSDVDRTIVPAFLAEMDGVEDSGALIILATNRPEMLDPAVIREGRIDKKVQVPRPNATTFARILNINLGRYPVAEDAVKLSAAVTKYVFEDKHTLYNLKMTDGSVRAFGMKNILSGALGAAIIQQAASVAMNRDLASGKVTGVQYGDLLEVVDEMVHQHRHLDYKKECDDFIGVDKDNVISIEQVLV